MDTVSARLSREAPSPKPAVQVPLAVDLDGTLILNDLTREAFFKLVKRNPLAIFAVLVWLFRGSAYTKRQISQRTAVDVTVLPYFQELLDYLKSQRRQGRRIILASASDELIVRLVAEFGEKGFDYAGDSHHDLSVWAAARRAILINPSNRLMERVAQVAVVEHIFRSRK